MKILRVFLLIIMSSLALVLVSCSEWGEEMVYRSDWGEEMVYLRIDSGENTLNYGITADGELMQLVANHGVTEFDFSECKTGDILRVDVYLIQEIFPANAVYLRIKPTGETGEVKLNEWCGEWLDETLQNGVWKIAE